MALFSAIAGLVQAAFSIFMVGGPLGAASSDFVLERETGDEENPEEGVSQ